MWHIRIQILLEILSWKALPAETLLSSLVEWVY